ncbi:MAG: tyrosine-type recombinase/integrase [Steroidobacteraceae bacterium]
MGIVKRGNSQYWYIQFQFQGHTYIRSAKTTEKRVAEQMEREWKRELHARTYLGQKDRITIKAAVEQFLASRMGTPGHHPLSVNSVALFRLFRVNRFLDEITSIDLEKVKRDREAEGVQPATIRHLFNLIRGAWKHARRLGYQVSQFEFPAVKAGKHRLRYLTGDEENRLVAELNPRRVIKCLPAYENRLPEMVSQMWDAHDLVILLLDTGARYSEIAGLEWRQVILESREIHLWRTKVQNESVLYMTDRVFEVLNRRTRSTNTSPYLFQNKAGGRRGYTSQPIRKALKRAGITGCSIHTLRHTHASRLIQNGMSVYEVKEVLGHSDIKTTMRYAHLEKRQVHSKARDVINHLNLAHLAK